MALNNDDKKWIKEVLGEAVKPLDSRLGRVETRLGVIETDIKVLKKDVKKIKKDASETVDYLEKRENVTLTRVEKIEEHLGFVAPVL